MRGAASARIVGDGCGPRSPSRSVPSRRDAAALGQADCRILQPPQRSGTSPKSGVMLAVVQSSHRWRRTVWRLVAGVLGAAFTTSSAHAGPPGPAVDLVAVLANDGLSGYGGSLDSSLDTLVDDGVVESAASAPPPDGVDRA